MGAMGAFFVNGPLFQLPENLRLDSSLRLLDIGCGRGAVMRMLDARVRFEHPPVGVDFSSAALQLADADERHAWRPTRLVRGTATALPLADGSFDLVICGHVLKHLDDSEALRLFREILRVLAPGGLALLWEFAPTGNRRLDAWNEAVLAAGVRAPRLRSTLALLQLAKLTGIEFRRAARLRPFLVPPIPRASVLIGNPPAPAR
jgi:ubiquinone/menaquinone biosynthesis C-methylase UbiE